ncbi:hypothetical protein DFJ58DRAFT_867307 [Suillus subalutaceus]|uniref:uncharacterized protein n=1 Tax=Suillus subalutaceus TaxID=48586 RepID=UPI001B867DCF|nr:uncharacterized protein DFJ58DRAFT_867307 [Suillus subalutaceus]KAG1835910.1 hypothetical protein DFJ58DRAFT_867307 [Suillus subalutaceus]
MTSSTDSDAGSTLSTETIVGIAVGVVGGAAVTSQDIPALSPPQIPLDWSYFPPVLPNPITDHSYHSLYDTDDPFARIQRAILPTTAPHHTAVSARRVSHEVPLEQRASASTQAADIGSRSTTRVCQHLKKSREGVPQPRTAGGEADANSPESISPESIYSQESAQHPSHPPEPQLPSQSSRRGRPSQRYSRTLKISELSPVRENSTSMSGPPSHDVSTSSEIEKKPSRTFSELERSSSVSVALSHNASPRAPECASLPLLSSSNTFGKSGSSASTLSPSSSRATRYPSLTPSSLGPSSSSNPHADSATEWHRPPAGLNALKGLQTLDLPNPHAPTLEVPRVPALPPADRQSPAADEKSKKTPLKARLCAHSPCSVPEVERRPVIQCGIANIDVTL